jgi:small nuclear ribonucleoprotein (snRNP)-like protein
MSKRKYNIERPLDLLNALKGKDVTINLKDGSYLVCKLHAFDIHLNLAVELDTSFEFIQGESISSISDELPKTEDDEDGGEK